MRKNVSFGPMMHLASLGLWVLIWSGCTSAGRTTTPAPSDARALSPEVVTTRLTEVVDAWKGTPHVWGGTTQQGADCSGFIQTVYWTEFDLPLPRTTGEQVRAGVSVRRRALEAGDLVFFRLSGKTNHVGIYLREGTFVHASSSQGVMVSHLDEPYWNKRYWTSRRVLHVQPERTRSRTTGW